jgi:predicted RNase H-like nuclease (RuvC/YqgF family)
MVKNINIDLIIERAMVAFGVKNQEQLADILNISPSDLSARKRRGTLTKLIEKEADRHNKNYNWIKTGQGKMQDMQNNASAHALTSDTSRSSVREQQSDCPSPDILLRKAAKVLRSNSSFCRALDSNIESFHEAIELREDLDIARAELKQCQVTLAEQNTLIAQQNEKINQQNQKLNQQHSEIENFNSMLADEKRTTGRLNGEVEKLKAQVESLLLSIKSA